MKNISLIYIFLLFFHFANGQRSFKVVELAVSYDTQFALATGDPVAAIEETLQDDLNDFFNKYDIAFHIVKVQSFGNMNLDYRAIRNPLERVTGAWVNGDQLCYKRDLVIHLTGHEIRGLGQSVLGNLACETNSTDYINEPNFCAVVEYHNNLVQTGGVLAHELCHLLGLGHVPRYDAVGNPSNNLMTPSGNDVLDNSVFLNNDQVAELHDALSRDCISRVDFDPNVVCTDLMSHWMGETEVNTSCTSHAKHYKFILRNDETPRVFKKNRITLRPFNKLEVSEFRISTPDGVEQSYSINDLPYYTDSDNSKTFTIPDFSIGANQLYTLETDILWNTTGPLANNDVIGTIGFRSLDYNPQVDGQSTTTYFNRGLIIENRTIDLPQNANAQELLDRIYSAENPGYPVHKSNIVDIIVNGVLTIDQDVAIDMKYRFKMMPNSEIRVTNNSNFGMFDSSILPCDQGRWNGIIVEPGSSLDFSGSAFEKGKRAIHASNGAGSIKVENCTFSDFTSTVIDINGIYNLDFKQNILENSNTGLELSGNGTITFEDNTLNNLEVGMWVLRNDNFALFERNELRDISQYGYILLNSSGEINNGVFTNVANPIYMYRSVGSMISNNQIDYTNRAIYCSQSDKLMISHNTIGNNTHGEVAIELNNCDVGEITYNSTIKASRIGISGMHCNINILNNSIVVNASYGLSSGGILLGGSYKSQIKDNIITGYHVPFGIKSVNGSNTDIHNNSIWIFNTYSNFSRASTAALAIEAGANNSIEENELFFQAANITGIGAYNAVNNTFICNDIFEAKNAMVIGHNAPSQTIIGNDYFSLSTDLIVKSRLGWQIHHGNEFHNGHVVALMEPEDVIKSLFLVNKNYPYHMPTDIEAPTKWFDHEDMLPKKCGGSVGPGKSMFQDPKSLCAYLAHIQVLKASNPKVYFTKMLHVLKYLRSQGKALPDCIKDDPRLKEICGLLYLAMVDAEIKKTIGIDSSDTVLRSYSKELSVLQKALSTATKKDARSSLRSKITKVVRHIRPLLDAKMETDSLAMRGLQNTLSSLPCTDSTAVLNKEIWNTYIDQALKTKRIDRESPSHTTPHISRLCADTYGDPVHLSRFLGMINGDYTYYDVYDGCMDEPNPETRSGEETTISLTSYPVPSVGRVMVDFGVEVSGRLRVIDVSGRTLIAENVTMQRSIPLNVDAKGVHTVELIVSDGRIYRDRICIID